MRFFPAFSRRAMLVGSSMALLVASVNCADSQNAPPAVIAPGVAIVTVGPTSVSVNIGQTFQLVDTLRDAGGVRLTGQTVVWSTSNSAIATVSNTGTVTGVAAGTATISATSNSITGQATVIVLPAPTTVGTVFESSWSTGTGNSDNVLSDGGLWDVMACSSRAQVLTVVPGASVGFSEAANVLRVQMLGFQCGVLQKTAAVPLSTTHWGRFYIRNDETGTRNDHTMAYNNIHFGTGMQAVPFSRYAIDQAAGQWRINILIRAAYPFNRWWSPPMQNGVWYRYEYQMEFVTATTFRFRIRVYNAAGTQLFTESSMMSADGRQSLASWYDIAGANRTIELGVLNTETPGPSQARNFGIGNEGPASGSSTGGYWYYGKLALSTQGWIGR